jgi:hypothetical protein
MNGQTRSQRAWSPVPLRHTFRLALRRCAVRLALRVPGRRRERRVVRAYDRLVTAERRVRP